MYTLYYSTLICFKCRMLPFTFEFILNEISNNLIRTTDGNKIIPPDKQLLLSLWHNLIFRSIKQNLNFWHFYSETDQNCVGKNLLCPAESELEAKIYDVLLTSYMLLRYFKVPNGSIKVTLQTIRSICSAKGQFHQRRL